MTYNLTAIEAARKMSDLVFAVNRDVWSDLLGIIMLMVIMIVLYSSMTRFPHTERMTAVTFLNMLLSWLAYYLVIVPRIVPFISIFLFIISAILMIVADRG